MKLSTYRQVRNLALALLVAGVPLFAGGGRLAATAAVNNLGQEFSGPLAYGVSLIMTVAAAFSWYRHHNDLSSTGHGLVGALFIAGIALGATTLLGFVGGGAGALI